MINTTITSSKVFSPRTFLITAKTRQNYDPVLDEWVTEYQIPHDKVVFDDKSQNRDTGTPQGKTSSLSHEMNTVGQKTGIKVEINDGDFLMRWGNTRYGGVDKLYTNENGLDEQFCVVKNCDKGMIWASIWDGKSKDLCRMQARENNLHETKTPANVHDNLRSMKEIIDNGHLDYDGKDFDDCDDAEKEKRARKEVDTTMPFFGGKKFKSFWNKYKRRTSLAFRLRARTLKCSRTTLHELILLALARCPKQLQQIVKALVMFLRLSMISWAISCRHPNELRLSSQITGRIRSYSPISILS